MWSTDYAKKVLAKANKVFEERRALGINDEVLGETAQYLDFVLTTYLWTEENTKNEDAKRRIVDGR
jgi:hypothetical protein